MGRGRTFRREFKLAAVHPRRLQHQAAAFESWLSATDRVRGHPCGTDRELTVSVVRFQGLTPITPGTSHLARYGSGSVSCCPAPRRNVTSLIDGDAFGSQWKAQRFCEDNSGARLAPYWLDGHHKSIACGGTETRQDQLSGSTEVFAHPCVAQ